MRECKLVHINDGRPEELTNGNFYFAETYPRAERELEKYLDQGYELKAMVPNFTPGNPGGGGYAFYETGFVFYLEREVPDGERRPEEPSQPESLFDEEVFRTDGEDLEDWNFDVEEEE